MMALPYMVEGLVTSVYKLALGGSLSSLGLELAV